MYVLQEEQMETTKTQQIQKIKEGLRKIHRTMNDSRLHAIASHIAGTQIASRCPFGAFVVEVVWGRYFKKNIDFNNKSFALSEMVYGSNEVRNLSRISKKEVKTLEECKLLCNEIISAIYRMDMYNDLYMTHRRRDYEKSHGGIERLYRCYARYNLGNSVNGVFTNNVIAILTEYSNMIDTLNPDSNAASKLHSEISEFVFKLGILFNCCVTGDGIDKITYVYNIDILLYDELELLNSRPKPTINVDMLNENTAGPDSMDIYLLLTIFEILGWEYPKCWYRDPTEQHHPTELQTDAAKDI